jgi:hypothetical protein
LGTPFRQVTTKLSAAFSLSAVLNCCKSQATVPESCRSSGLDNHM